LYLLIDDLEGALRHYKWFARKFSDSSDEPLHTLCWALALHRAGKPKDALHRLRRAHLANPYLIPHMLDLSHGQPDIPKTSWWDGREYIDYIEPGILSMWTPEELNWLRRSWEQPAFQELVRTHADLASRLDREPVGPARSALVDALSELADRPKSRARRPQAKPSEGERSH
jgi:hypothetical protein